MATEFITIIECCNYHHIESSFIHSLEHAGLIEITVVEKEELIHLNQLPELEKYIRLHYDLDINTEGIETIRHLLDKVHQLQAEVATLRNRLNLYE
jgi:chaperone modulatory protein CbpM